MCRGSRLLRLSVTASGCPAAAPPLWCLSSFQLQTLSHHSMNEQASRVSRPEKTRSHWQGGVWGETAKAPQSAQVASNTWALRARLPGPRSLEQQSRPDLTEPSVSSLHLVPDTQHAAQWSGLLKTGQVGHFQSNPENQTQAPPS